MNHLATAFVFQEFIEAPEVSVDAYISHEGRCTVRVLRVRDKKIKQGWTIKQFNDWALSFGTLPWRWMEISGL